METKLVEAELGVSSDDPVDSIIKDIQRTHILLNAEAGHGKSSSLMSIVKEIKKRIPGIVIKCFDPSLAWYHKAPLKHRQSIKMGEPWQNIGDCVYEIGSLSEDERRIFASVIIRQDYGLRLRLGRKGKREIDRLPMILYIFEEADTFFDSASLNKKDEASATLRDFVKIGRNFGLRAFCVVTATVGELGTKLRRRSKHLIGKIISDSDLRLYNRKKKGLGNLALGLPQYHWVYYNGRISEVFRIHDEVETKPVDFILKRQRTLEDNNPAELSLIGKIVLGLITGFTVTGLTLMLVLGL